MLCAIKYQVLPFDDILIPLKANVLFLLQFYIIHKIIHIHPGYFQEDDLSYIKGEAYAETNFTQHTKTGRLPHAGGI